MIMGWANRVRRWYTAVEEAMGMMLPILALASVMPDLVSLRAVALTALWIGCGHTLLYYFGLYPQLRYRPFFKGLFAFGAGVCWPLWFLRDSPARR